MITLLPMFSSYELENIQVVVVSCIEVDEGYMDMNMKGVLRNLDL